MPYATRRPEVHLDENQIEVANLIGRTALADRSAFRDLYARTSAKLFGVALRILGDRGEAEDALQDIYVKIWQRAGQYRDDMGSPMTWLIAIARNHAIDIVRRRKPDTRDIDETHDIADPQMTPEQSALNASERARLNDCLDTLPDGRAEAVKSAYVEGYSYQELATRFAIPLNTVRTWLRRGLLQLRECLDT